MDFARWRRAEPRGPGVLKISYSFDDAQKVLGSITRTFATFYESECQEMRENLLGLDVAGTGRIPLSKFYHAGINKDTRFAESEAYLRELGALDESSQWAGKQVIIPNYLLAASNCHLSTPHYLVCCINRCEGILSEIEMAVGSA